MAGIAALALAAALPAAGAANQRGAAAASPATPTYSRDVAPILFARCASCHHPDGPAPFSVLTWTETRRHATQIAMVTASRYMPPAKAEPGYGDFIGQRRLTDSELATIQQWVAAGAPEGDPAGLPPLPSIARGWQLGTPDLVVTLPSYRLPASGNDQFRIFVVPIPTAARRFVRGFEFHPGQTSVVHHANIRVDRTRNSRRLDEEDPQPGYDGLLAHSAAYPDGHFLAWTPGQAAPLLPKGLSWRLDPGTDLVVELHLQPTGKDEVIEPTVGLYFTDAAPERTPGMLRLGRQNIDIAAGDAAYVVTDRFTVPVAVRVLAVQPHAHYRAREVRGDATLPDGSTRPLILIRDWDFRWQQVYRYVTPLALPAGTTLTMRYVYDNSTANPRNPGVPKRVIWGQRSDDEMGDLWIQVLTGSDRDLDRLLTALRPKVIAEDIIGYEARITAEPASVALHDDVALLYLDQGNVRKAVEHFQQSAALRPSSAAAQFNLGTAFAFGGAIDAALAHYREALRLDADYALAHNNLGGLLLQRGAVAEAAGHLERAAALDPDNPDVRFNLGRLYRQTADPRACDQFRQALALRPGWEPAAREFEACGAARR